MASNFNQQVVHATIAAGKGAFYDSAALDGPAYSYNKIFAQSSGGTALTLPAGAQTFGGSGTLASPYFLQTMATSTANPAGITVQDRITYVNGDAYYRNDVTLTNTTGAPVTLNFYRFADCVLAGADSGFSSTPATSADCRDASTALSLIPVTEGATLQSGHSSAAKARVDGNLGLTNTCLASGGAVLTDTACQTTSQDNALALAYPAQAIGAGESVTLIYLTNYASLGVTPATTADLRPNVQEAPTSAAVGETFTYRLNLTSSGPSNTTSVSVSAPIPPELTFISSTGNGTFNGTTGLWTIGNVAAFTTWAQTITVRANREGFPRLAINSVQSSLPDPTPCVAGSTDNCGTMPVVSIIGLSVDNSSYTVSSGTRVANGTDTHTITVSLRSVGGSPITGRAGDLTAVSTPSSGVTVGAFAATATAGEYQATVRSTVAGTKSIVARVSGANIPLEAGGNSVATFVAGAANPGNSTVAIDSQGVRIADGEQARQVTVTLRDANGNPVTGQAANLSAATPTGVSVTGFAATATPGVYTALVTSTRAGTQAVVVSASGTGIGAVDAVFVAGPLDLTADSTLIELTTSGSRTVSDPATTDPGDATHVHVARVTLTDAFGNPVAGDDVTFELPAEVLPVQGASTTVTTDADGRAQLALATTVAGSYEVSARAEGGQIINGSPVTAVFVPELPVFGAGQTNIAATDGEVEADGVQTHTVTVTARDRFANPVPGVAVEVTLPADVTAAGTAPTFGTTDANGTFTVPVTSTVAGTYDITATAAGTAVTQGSPATVTFAAGAPSATQSSFAVTPAGPLTVGSQYAATATVRDALGNPVEGEAVTFAVAPGAQIVESGPYLSDALGVVTVHVTSTVAGTFATSAALGGNLIEAPIDVTFTAGAPDVGQDGTELSRSTPTITVTADGTATHDVTATVVDQYDNPVPGAAVTFTLPANVVVAGGGSATIPTGADGTATLSVVSTVAGSYDVTATVGGSAITNGSPVQVQFIAGPVSQDNSDLALTPAGPLVVGDDAANTYTALTTVRDAQNNPVAGVQVALTSDPELIQSSLGGVTDANGQVVVTLTSHTAGSFTISATARTIPLGSLPASETRDFVAAAPDLAADGNSTLTSTAGTRTANGAHTHVLTATVQDVFGNPVPGQDVIFDLPGALTAVGGSAVIATGANGIATLAVTSTTSGNFPVSAYAGPVGPAALIRNGDPQPLNFVPGAADPATSTLSVTPAAPLPVGTGAGSTYTAALTVRDAFGNGVPNATVNLGLRDSNDDPVTADQPALSATQVLSAADGTASVTVSSTTSGSYALAATLAGFPLTGSPTPLTWVPGPATATGSVLNLTTGSKTADGLDSHTATLSARDAFGNIVTDPVDFELSVQSPATGSGTVTTGADGTVSVPLTTTVAGTYAVSATLAGESVYPGAGSVVFGPAQASPITSLITAAPATVTADGITTSTVTVQLVDAFGNALDASGGTVTMATTAGTLGPVTDNTDGTYTATLTSATLTGTATVSFTVNAVAASKTATVAFTPGSASAAESTIAAGPGAIIANGTSTSTVTVTVRDAFGNPVGVGGDTVAMSTTAGTLGPVTDNTDGTYTATLTSATVTGTATVSFTVNAAAATNTATVTFTPGAVSATESTIAAAPGSITANGTSTSTVTVTVRDAFGNPVGVGDDTVTMSTTAGTLSPVTDNTDGTYTATLTSATTAGAATVSFTVNATAATNTATVTFTPGAVSAVESTITAVPASITADGATTSTVTVTLRDAFGNALDASGGTVTIYTTTGALSPVTDNTDGTYTATLTSATIAGTATVSFKVNAVAATNTATVVFTPGAIDAAESTIAASVTTLVADGITNTTITVTLRDAQGNPIGVGGSDVDITATAGTLGPVTDNGDGTYTADITAPTLAQEATIGFTVNGDLSPRTLLVTFVPGVPSPARSTIAAAPPSITADGVTTSTVTVTLIDAFDNPVGTGDDTVTMSTTAGTLSPVTDNADGTYSATLTSPTVTGTATISFTVNTALAANTTTVALTPGPANATASTIAASPASITANGTSTSTVTVAVRDAFGNAVGVGGDTVTMATTAGTLGPVTDNTDGTYTATLTSATLTGTATVSFTVNAAAATNTTTVTFTPGAVTAAESTIAAIPASVTADGVSTSTVTVTVRDAFGNAVGVGGDTVTMSTTAGTLGPVTDNTDGTYSATLTSATVTGTANVSFTVNAAAATNTAAVIFTPGAVTPTTATIAAVPASVTADGVSTSTVTVTVRDAFGNAVGVGGDTVTMATTAGTLSPVTDNTDGTYTATLTSATVTGTANVSFTVNAAPATHTTTVTFTPGAVSAAESTIAAGPGAIIANGTSTSTVTVTVRDAFGNAVGVGGDTVTMATTAGTLGPVTDNTDGTYTATLTSATTAGTASISFTVNAAPATNTTTVTFTPGAASAAESTIAAGPGAIIANGTSTSTVTVTVRDAFGNAVGVGGDTVTMATTAGTLGPVTDNTDGTYTATLTSPTVTGTSTVSFTVNAVAATNTATVTFTPGAVTATESTIAAIPGSITADGVSTSTVTVTVRDAFGNPVGVGGDTVAMATTAGTLSPVTDNTDGTYTATLTSATATGTATVSFTVNAVAATNTTTVTFTPGAVTAAESTIAAAPGSVTADGVTTSTVTVTVRDAFGNPVGVGGDTVAMSTTAGTLGPVTDNTDGTYTATLTSATTAGTASISFTVNAVAATNTTTVTFTPGAVTAAESTIAAAPDSITADGATTSTVTVTVRDAFGNPVGVGDDTVAMSTTAGTLGPVTDNTDGTYTATLTSPTVTGTSTVSFTVNAVAATNTATVTFTPGAVTAAESTITAAPGSVTADGVMTSTVTVTVRDAFGNPVGVGGDTVAMSTTAGTLSPVTDNTDGTYTATLTSATATGTATVSFTVNAVAATNTATVTFTPGAVTPTTSTITAAPDSITADGVTTSTVTVTVRDAFGNPVGVGGDTVAMATTAGTLGPVTDNTDGTYTATLTSATTAGTASISFTVNAVAATNTATVTFTPGAVTPTTATIAAVPASVTADGVSTSTVTVTVRDAFGNAVGVGGDTVSMATTAGTLGPVTDNTDGTYTATLTSPTVTGTSTVSFTVNAVAATHTATVTFTPGAATPTTSTITAAPDSITADGATTSTITVTARDAFGNALDASGGTVTMATTAGTLSPVTDNTDGTYTATLTSATATGTATVSFTVNAVAATNTATVTFTPGAASAAISTITAVPSSITADGVSTSTVTVTVRDVFGNVLRAGGDTVSMATTAGTLSPVTDNTDGTYTATLTSATTAGTASISFTVNAAPATNTATVTFTPGAVTPTTSTITADPDSITADGATTSTITVTARDAFGNALGTSGGTVTMDTTAGTLGPVTDNTDGTYTAILTSATTAGAATVSFTVNAVAATNTATVAFTPGDISAGESTIAASVTTVVADGITNTTITITLRDGLGNPVGVGGSDVIITTTAGTLGPVTDNGDGTYTADITAPTLAQEATVGFSVDGNVSSRTLLVTFVPGVASPARSTITATPTSTTADGTSTSTITTTLIDAFDNPVGTGGDTVTMSTTAGTLGPVTDNTDGTYTATLTAPTTVSQARVEFTIDGNLAAARTTVDFLVGPPSATTSTIVASPPSLIGNSGATSAITVTVFDVHGNRLTTGGTNITMATTRGTLSGVSDLGDGRYTATLTAGPLGTATLSFTVEGTTATATAQVAFVPGLIDLSSATIAAAPTTIESDGTSTSVVTVTVIDAFDSPVAGADVTLTTSAGSLGTVTDNGDGTYSAELTSATSPRTAIVGFAVNGLTGPTTVDVIFEDTTPPAPPTITGPTASSIVTQLPVISGTGEPGANVQVLDGSGTALCASGVATDGTWSCTPATPLPRGSVELFAIQTDPSGNVSVASVAVDVTIVGPLSLTVVDLTVTQGGSTTVTAEGFIPGEEVTGVVNSTPLPLGTIPADSAGSVTFQIDIPADFTPGLHTITLAGALSGTVSGELTVTKAQSPTPVIPVVPLPRTGAEVLAVAIGAGILVLLGLGLTLLRRRRG